MIFMLIKTRACALHIVISLKKVYLMFVIYIVDLVALIRCIWS